MTARSCQRRASARRLAAQPGFSLVELLIGTAIGLWVMLGATQLMAHHFASYRAQVKELRLNQELRAAIDVIGRDLKRAGHWDGALVAFPTLATTEAPDNPFSAVVLDGNTPSSTIEYSYDRTDPTPPLAFGFRRRQAPDGTGLLQMKNAAGGWQPLTDPAVVNVTQLSITAALHTVELWESCQCRFGATRSTGCEDAELQHNAERPRLLIQQFDVRITGTAVGDPGLSRAVEENVALGNITLLHPNGCPAD